jgi:uncharacterized surface protein with fasciclin (FAS1) repeats
MNIARLAARVAVGAVATVVATAAVGVPAAQATGKTKPLGTKSLAAVLTADTSGFDHNPHDFDILTAAVLAVLKAKPESPVKVLTDGKVALTTFAPTDAAFRRLAQEITHSHSRPGEADAFKTVAGLGIDTVESVLLYHVVPGATITKKDALKADGADLTTAAGSTIEVDVRGKGHEQKVWLVDADTDDRNPLVVVFDINKGNRQIAHAVDRVLRPVDLP